VEDTAKAKQGFAALSPERRREISRMGGKSVPVEKRSFFQDPSLAAQAGRVGGRSVDPANRSFSKDPALAAKAGVKGGKNSRQARTSDKD
jgi:uncharacterized protein